MCVERRRGTAAPKTNKHAPGALFGSVFPAEILRKWPPVPRLDGIVAGLELGPAAASASSSAHVTWVSPMRAAG